MVSSTFRGTVTQREAARNQTVSTVSRGVQDASIAAIGVMAYSGALGAGTASQMAKHALANRVGGIGGNIMVSSIEEKRGTAIQAQEREALLFSPEEFERITTKTLEGNRINASALKQMGTVFEVLKRAKEAKEESANGTD